MTVPEAPRDLPETAFTPMLRALIRGAPTVLAAAFVDEEGECVDYCSTSVSAYEAKIIGAQLLVVVKIIHAALGQTGGVPILTHVVASQRDLFVRRISEDYTLVAVAKRTVHQGETIAMIERTISAFRAEAGIPRPAFEGRHGHVFVDVRESPWGFAPATLYERGDRIEILDVLGRWTEGQGQGERLGFLTRSERGDELVLFCDPRTGRWERRP